MEPIDPERHGPLLRCREDGGLPTKLVGESDAFCLPATEELIFELEGSGVQDGDAQSHMRAKLSGRDTHNGVRVRLTTHRLLWWTPAANCWLAVRLDAVSLAEASGGGVFRPRRCELKPREGGPPIAVRRAEAEQTDELLAQVQAAIGACDWRRGSYEEAAMGGLQRILGQRENRQQAVGETLDLALADLESLRQHAAQAAVAARQVGLCMASQAGGEGAGVQQLLEDFGLLAPDGTAVVKGGQLKADIEEDVARVCRAALEKRGGLGMLLAHDVFCLVNRARGTALVSPEEVMTALRRCAQPGGPLRLRMLGSTSALAVSLSRTSDRDTDAQLVRMAQAAPLSAFKLAKELNLTAAEAQYLLKDTEARAALVRDDAPEGVFYFPNLFERF
uniref:Vacuolar protein-sorting-associated protein 36 n=1 Tax=Pyrodinium bahamense TaxID=73915 RepID=A0A7S0FY44_9DINO|mmetsp:Transcript_9345/g.26290  ORF Transcript_9345/g.26290 Transcript_9345/m.26290 type:complete len:391 (+) Transcript_9345:51-1223(+)